MRNRILCWFFLFLLHAGTLSNLDSVGFTAALGILDPNPVVLESISGLGHVKLSYPALQLRGDSFNKPYQIITVFPLYKAKGTDTNV